MVSVLLAIMAGTCVVAIHSAFAGPWYLCKNGHTLRLHAALSGLFIDYDGRTSRYPQTLRNTWRGQNISSWQIPGFLAYQRLPYKGNWQYLGVHMAWWMLVPMVTGYPILNLLRGPIRRFRRRRRGLCVKCGYNLSGNASGVCPECGTRA